MSIDKVAVVGGGIVGTACAYFLAREGKRVTLFEETALAHGASGRNPGFVWLHTRNPGFGREVSLASRALYDQLVEDLPLDFEFRPSGGIIFYTTEEQGAIVRELVETVQADGYPMEHIDGAEVRRMVEPIREDVLGASFCPADACINTPLLVRSFAEGARQAAADIREGVGVTRLIEEGGRVVGVETSEGRFEADAVVLGAGAWARKLADTVGIQLAVGGERLQVAATVPPQAYTPQRPVFKDLASRGMLYARSYGGRQMLVSEGLAGQVLEGTDDRQGEVDMDFVAGIGEQTAQRFPAWAEAGLASSWTGVYDVTPDWNPVLGPLPEVPGLVVGYGFSGHGFKLSPAVGRVLAQAALGLPTDVSLAPYALERFRAGRLLTGRYGAGAVS